MRRIARRQLLVGGASSLAMRALPAAADDGSPPRTNQIGYTPSARKTFCLAAEASDFSVVGDGGAVFAGRMEAAAFDRTAATGEIVRRGDFSAFATPGTYRIRAGGRLSHPFVIGDAVYRDALRDAARAFHLIRANTDIDDARTGLRVRAGHAADAAAEFAGRRRDLSGGWYNAGDYGKWTHMAALSASHMMWLFELRPALASLNLDVANDDALPDLLAEARWGIDFLLRMQTEDGRVIHKIDSEPNFAWGRLPADDAHARIARDASSLDAGFFAGAMAQAARVFRPFDARFAERCGAAALKSWAWLEANPEVFHRDPYYVDREVWHKRLWALCEIAAMTGDATLEDQAVAELNRRGVTPCGWMTPQILGALCLARRNGTRGKDAAVAAILAAADQIVRETADDPYGFFADPSRYVWGSVENALNAANACLLAHAFGGPAAHRNAGTALLDYVLGNNCLGLCFVAGHGSRTIRRPFHWACVTLDIALPGWASGGPNGRPEGADPLLKALIGRGTPPAKCHIDVCGPDGSWASNEGQTSENAALLLALGLAS